LGVDCNEIQICGASTRNEYIKRALAFNNAKKSKKVNEEIPLNENNKREIDSDYDKKKKGNKKPIDTNAEEQIGKLYMCNRLVTENDTFSSLIEEITKHEEIIDPQESWLTCGLRK